MGAKRSLRSRAPSIVGGLFLLLFAIGVVMVIRNFILNGEKPNVRKVQQISIIQPPPPKPPEEKPPEPEKQEIKQDVNIPEPQQEAQPNEPPPGQSLALDADASAGTDGFGLGANKGGKSLIGGGGSRFGWYSGTIQQAFQDALMKNKANKGDYRAIVRLWISPDGSVKRFELSGSSGKPDVDKTIIAALEQIKTLGQPPEDMPQPVKLRISSR